MLSLYNLTNAEKKPYIASLWRLLVQDSKENAVLVRERHRSIYPLSQSCYTVHEKHADFVNANEDIVLPELYLRGKIFETM